MMQKFANFKTRLQTIITILYFNVPKNLKKDFSFTDYLKTFQVLF